MGTLVDSAERQRLTKAAELSQLQWESAKNLVQQLGQNGGDPKLVLAMAKIISVNYQTLGIKIP